MILNSLPRASPNPFPSGTILPAVVAIALLAVDSAPIVLYGPNPFSRSVIGPILYCHFDHDAIAKEGDAGDRYELHSESSVAVSRRDSRTCCRVGHRSKS